MNQNNLEKIFRQGTDGKRRFTQANETSMRFSNLCKSVINGNTDFHGTALHVGFGIPTNGKTPLRMPVTIIPTLQILDGLEKAGLSTPKCIIYQATDLIAQVNHIDINTARNIGFDMEVQLQQFVRTNFPHLKEKIQFFFGPQPQDKEIIEKIFEYSKETSNILDEKQKTHFQNCESKHSNGEGQSGIYVTANNFYNGGYDEYAFPEVGEVERIIPIGGRSEKQFFETLIETQTSVREIFPLITQVGSYPSYYGHTRGDVFTQEELSQFHQNNFQVGHPDIEKDLHTLSPYHI